MLNDVTKALLLDHGYQEMNDSAWILPEIPYRGDKSKIRNASLIRITDMGHACGYDGFYVVEAEETSFDYMEGKDVSLESAMGDRDWMHQAWRAGRTAFRLEALTCLAVYGIADPAGYGKANWTVTEKNLHNAVDVAIRIVNGQYVNLPEVVESDPEGVLT